MNLTDGIVAILNSAGHIVGTGFVVSEQMILTCAHVIEKTGGKPGERVAIRYHHQGELRQAKVDEAGWRPAERDDIAVLHLLEALPEGVRPLALGSSHASQGHAFQAFGYPAIGDYQGNWATGSIEGRVPKADGRQMLQLTSSQLSQGHSGCPVWDETLGQVVGMVAEVYVAGGQLKNRDTAFATPAEALLEASPALAKPRPPIENPFGYRGRIEDPALYLARRPLTDEIFGELRKGVSLSVVGESQAGKSSLLWHITQTGPQALARLAEDFVYLSMELIHSEEDFFECLCEELGIVSCRGFRLGRALRDRKVVLCLDEFEKMSWQGFTQDVRSQLRGLADGSAAPLTLVLASRSPLNRLFPDSPEMTSPLAGLCTQISLPPFTLKEAETLAALRLAGSGLSLPQAEIQRAWEASGGHAARLQQALKEAFDRMCDQ